MNWSDIPRDPPPRMLRQFAGLWLAFFGIAACWQWLLRGRMCMAFALVGLAVAVGLPGLVWPRSVRPVFVGWMVAAFPLGWLVSRVLIAALYFTVFTPISLVFRLTGRDALALRRNLDRTTYWTPRPTTIDPRRYLREF
jgi:hypothetical protein